MLAVMRVDRELDLAIVVGQIVLVLLLAFVHRSNRCQLRKRKP